MLLTTIRATSLTADRYKGRSYAAGSACGAGSRCAQSHPNESTSSKRYTSGMVSSHSRNGSFSTAVRIAWTP
jgi:hypothetical protein